MSPIKAIPYHPVATPQRSYTITFLERGLIHTAMVDPSHLPYGNTGLPGSILDSALHVGIDLPHLCGGVAGCSTYHVTISQGIESCNEAQEAEVDQLIDAAGHSLQSRLACQCVPNGTSAIVVTVPTAAES
jgi:2Fe-2S ferredoxin